MLLFDFEKALLAEFLKTHMNDFVEITRKYGFLYGRTIAHKILQRLEERE